MGRRTHALLIATTALTALLAVVFLTAGMRGDDPGSGDVATSEEAVPPDVERAEQRLLATCMHRRGFSYPEEPPQAGESIPQVPDHPFGIDDIGWARAHGFGSDLEAAAAAAGKAAQAADPLARLVAAMSDTEREKFTAALYGSESDPAVSTNLPNGFVVSTRTRGCQAEARTALYQDQETWLRASAVVQVLPGLAVEAVHEDDMFRAKERAWSQCMREFGHEARDMATLRSDFVADSAQLDPAARRTQEVRLAVDEAGCSQRTGVTAFGERLRQDALSHLRQQHRASVADIHRLGAGAVVRAAQILNAPEATTTAVAGDPAS